MAENDSGGASAGLRLFVRDVQPALGSARQPAGGRRKDGAHPAGDHRDGATDVTFCNSQAPYASATNVGAAAQRYARLWVVVLGFRRAPRAMAACPLPGGSRWLCSSDPLRTIGIMRTLFLHPPCFDGFDGG